MWIALKQEEHHHLNPGLGGILVSDDQRNKRGEKHVLCRTRKIHPQRLISMFNGLKLDLDGEEEDLSEQETALYDRQIRIWGAPAQKRLSKTHIFVSGLNGTLIEVCKDVVLAGVGRLTLNDDRVMTKEELMSSISYLVPLDGNFDCFKGKTIAELCAVSLKELSPMLVMSIQKGDLSSFEVDLFRKFDAVVISCCSQSTKKSVNEKCRVLSKRVAFFTVTCRNSCGEIFIDMQNHYYLKKQKGSGEMIQCHLRYPSFQEALAIPWGSLTKGVCQLFFAMRVIESFEQHEGRNAGETSTTDLPWVLDLRNSLCDTQSLGKSHIPDRLLERLLAGTREFPPVWSILGGILAQEVIKAVSGIGEPLKNFFFFDANNGKGVVEDISATAATQNGKAD